MKDIKECMFNTTLGIMTATGMSLIGFMLLFNIIAELSQFIYLKIPVTESLLWIDQTMIASVLIVLGIIVATVASVGIAAIYQRISKRFEQSEKDETIFM